MLWGVRMLVQLGRKLKLLLMGCILLANGNFVSAAEPFAENEAKLQRMLSEVVREYKAPGAALAIKYKDGSAFQGAAGVAEKEQGTPLTTAHYFRVGSASKTFTATAALLLYQDGLYDLDDTVETLLPDLPVLVPLRGKGITVKMLLNHTSGLDDYVELPYKDKEFFYTLIENPLRKWQPEELVAISVRHGLVSTPGDEFHYANTNYLLLGMIIEKVSGQKYEVFILEKLLNPLGLKHTSVPKTSGFPGTYAHGYFEKNADGILSDYSIQSPTAVWSAGNIISTAPDLMTWLEAFINGRLLKPAVKAEQFDFQLSDGNGYGLGVTAMNNALGHNGTIFGYQTQMFAYKGAYFVAYTNCHYLSKDNVSQVIFDRAKEIIFAE